MRFRGFLEEVLGGRTRIRVLRLLLRYPTKEFTGRELARLSRTSPSKAIRELNRLREHGVVERRTAGGTQLWRTVPDHYALDAVRPAFRAEERATAALQRSLARARPPGGAEGRPLRLGCTRRRAAIQRPRPSGHRGFGEEPPQP